MLYLTFPIFWHSVVTCLSPVGPHELRHLPFTPVTLTIAVFLPQQCCQLRPSISCSQVNPSPLCYFEYERDIDKLQRVGQHCFCLWLLHERTHHYCQLGHLLCFTKESIKGAQFISIRNAGDLAAT